MQLEFVMYRAFTLGFQVGNCTHGSGVQVKDLCRQGSGPGNKFWTSEGHSHRGEAEREWPVRQGENQETLVSRKPHKEGFLKKGVTNYAKSKVKTRIGPMGLPTWISWPPESIGLSLAILSQSGLPAPSVPSFPPSTLYFPFPVTAMIAA